MSKKQIKFDNRRLSIAISPILIFILLIPFMHAQVPYHTDLLGNVDGTGSKWALFGISALFSLAIYYVYGKRDEKKIVYPLVITILALLNILLLTGAIVESGNLFSGFYMYLNASYGNQVAFLLFCFSLFMFLFVEKIPPNSFIGIKNSFTNKSEMAWKMVHSRSRMQFWYGAMLNLLIFYTPSISAFAKLITSFLVMMICWIYIVHISKIVSKELNWNVSNEYRGEQWKSLITQQSEATNLKGFDFNNIPKNLSSPTQPALKKFVAGVKSFKENTSKGDSFYFLDPDGHKLELHYNTLEDRVNWARENNTKWV